MIDFCYNTITWAPWVSFFSECALIQAGLLVSIFFFNQARTLFYSLIYMFILFVWLGVFLCFFNVELFTGFLWVVELTVVFVIILFLFFFNFSGDLKSSRFFFFKFFAVFFFFFFDEVNCALELLNFNFFFDDFYESRMFLNMNDICSLFLSYYVFNACLLVIFGFLIFLASIICVGVLRAARAGLVLAIASALATYSFFKELLSFEFLRKQSLFYQNLRKPTTRLVKKNSQEWFKKSQD